MSRLQADDHGRSPHRDRPSPARMSDTYPASESGAIDLLVEARPRDIGGFAVRRALPSMRRRMVGPFVFFDHMGPADLPSGMAVRPHPRIGLATVTYLFDGEIDHRDSL